jgi:hypothetical protein
MRENPESIMFDRGFSDIVRRPAARQKFEVWMTSGDCRWLFRADHAYPDV